MRSCLIATALARRLEVPESEVADTYYTALLMHAKLAGDYLATVTDFLSRSPGRKVEAGGAVG